MDDVSSQKIKNDPSEEKIRHTCCIFLAVETVLLTLILFFVFDISDNIFSVSDFFTLLKVNRIEFSEVVDYLLIRIIPCGLAVLFTILSMRNKRVYIFYEIIHVIFGALLALYVCSFLNIVLAGSVIFILFYLRFFVYIIATRNR